MGGRGEDRSLMAKMLNESIEAFKEHDWEDIWILMK